VTRILLKDSECCLDSLGGFSEYWLAGSKVRFAFLFAEQETNAESEKEIKQNRMNLVNREGSENEKRKYTRKKETKERRDCSDWRKQRQYTEVLTYHSALFE
jgi:hypothetical protein